MTERTEALHLLFQNLLFKSAELERTRSSKDIPFLNRGSVSSPYASPPPPHLLLHLPMLLSLVVSLIFFSVFRCHRHFPGREETRTLAKTVAEGIQRSSKLNACISRARVRGESLRQRDLTTLVFHHIPLFVSRGKTLCALSHSETVFV